MGLLYLFLTLILRIPLLIRLVANPRVPFRTKLILVLAIGYIILPTDLLFDFLPIFGRLDDLIVLVLSIYFFTTLGSKYLIRAAKKKDEEGTIIETTYHFTDDKNK